MRLREGGRGRIADRQALAVRRDPLRIGNAHARGRAVPGEDHVMVEIDRARDREARHRRAVSFRASLSFSCFTTSETQPSPKLSQASMSTGRCAQQRPHRHFDGARVGGRNDADQMRRREPRSTSRVSVMARLRRALPRLERCERPMSAVLRRLGVQPGILAQGPEEKCAHAGRAAGFVSSCCAPSLQMDWPSVGRASPRPLSRISRLSASGQMKSGPR